MNRSALPGRRALSAASSVGDRSGRLRHTPFLWLCKAARLPASRGRAARLPQRMRGEATEGGCPVGPGGRAARYVHLNAWFAETWRLFLAQGRTFLCAVDGMLVQSNWLHGGLAGGVSRDGLELDVGTSQGRSRTYWTRGVWQSAGMRGVSCWIILRRACRP